MHTHQHCSHSNMSYCEVCDMAYCLDCGMEWGGNTTYINPIPITSGDKVIDIEGNRETVEATCNHKH